MAIELNHLIVPARDKEEAARFYARMFGLEYAGTAGYFAPVKIPRQSLTLDFDTWETLQPQHYAFKVGEAEFDEIFARIVEAGLAYGSEPGAPENMQINHWNGGRGVYFRDPSGHLLEILTRDEPGSAGGSGAPKNWLLATLACCALLAASAPAAAAEAAPARVAASESLLLGPPKGAGPAVIRIGFELQDINEINDGTETFDFSGVLTLAWLDPRQAFDPAVEGVDEKVFQGAFQFDEISPGWFPQLVLVNEAGTYQANGVVLRVRPDGTSTLVQTLYASAETDLDMFQFPLDGHRLEAVFEVLGFDRDEVELQAEPSAASSLSGDVRVPQWTITGVSTSVRDRTSHHAGRRGVSSAFVLSVDVQRDALYMVRLVVMPLGVIVLLSFSVFWMDRSSLSDRLSVSFIGILTGVAYQIVMSDHMPRISYVTLIHGFLNVSFLTMCATVVVNLLVAALDQRGMGELGHRIDRRCRWGFPLAYFGIMLILTGAAIARA